MDEDYPIDYNPVMMESRSFRQVVLIFVSFSILATVLVVAFNQQWVILLPMAGGLAGLSAFLLSSTMNEIGQRSRKLLRIAGGTTIALMAVLVLLKLLRH